MKRLSVVLVLCAALLAGCSSGALGRDDFEALEVGMEVDEAEAVIGSELVVESEDALGGGIVTVGYFGDRDGARIAVVAFDGEITRLEPVGLE